MLSSALSSPWKSMASLPRDSRDTLFLLLVIAWVILPQVGHLPTWCSLLVAAVLAWRGWLAWASKPLPSRWWLLGLLATTLAATWMSHRTILGRDAGVTLIVVLLALKTLELRARRDAFVVFFLGFFTMLTNFFFSQSLPTAAAMLLALLGLLTALVNAHMPVGRPSLAESARTAGWMALLGAPIMLVLFMLFPRLAPLWGIPSDAMSGRSGLSTNMTVGNIASLALDDGIAMHIRFNGPPPQQPDLYFRGPVLSSFDGREWRPPRLDFTIPQTTARSLQVSGAPVDYEVTLEPNNRPWLLLMDAAPRRPELPEGRALLTPELQWTATRPVTDLLRYRAQSYPVFRYGPLRRGAELQQDLELPVGFNPRTLALAAEMRRDPALAQADTPALVNAVMQRLRTGGYSYTLEPGIYGDNTADEFWFDRKAGFCEHIASAFVVLMRALDVPARIVTGYQGGDMNTVDNYWTVRQSDAHAWAEVWQAGRGWIRADPTSAVSPARIGSLTRLVAPRGVIATAFGNVSPDIAAKMRAAWEAVNNSWNQWVLNYTQSKQLDLLRSMGFTSPSWEDLSYLLLVLLVSVSLAGAVWTLWEKRQHDPWLRLLMQARARLKAAGIVVPAQAAPRQMADALQRDAAAAPVATTPDSSTAAARAWLLRMEAHRYARDPAADLAALRREFRGVAWPRRSAAANTAAMAATSNAGTSAASAN